MQPISQYDIAHKVYEINPKTGAVQEYDKDAAHVPCLYTTTESLCTWLGKYKSFKNSINAVNLLALSRLSAALHRYIKDKYPVQSYLWNFCTWLELASLKNFSREFHQAFIKQSRAEQSQIATLIQTYQKTPSDQTLEKIGLRLSTFQSNDMNAIGFFFNTRTRLQKTAQLTDYTFTLIKTHNLIAKEPVASWPIGRRFRQLSAISQNPLASSQPELLDLAYHIEATVLTKDEAFFEKSSYKVSRSIIKQNSTEQLFILTEDKLNEGGYKTVHRGVAVPFDTKLRHFPIADAIYKGTATMEAELQDLFSSQPPYQGICPVLYSDSKRIITPLGRPMAPTTNVVQAIIDLAQGLATIHKGGHIHGDLAQKNIIDFQGTRLIDFGFCFNPKTTPQPFPENFYGNIGYTPPEMLGGAREIDYFAAEMWAFGCLCYEMILNQPVPWKDRVERLYKPLDTKDPYVLSFIEAQIQELWQRCPHEDWVIKEVLRMLSFYPEDRPRSDQVLRYLRITLGCDKL